MNKGKIIVLNGVSSAGKSTLAKALTKELTDYFHMSVDDFDIFIEKMEERPNRLIPVETVYFFHRTIAMFSDKGVNVIVDYVIHDDFTRRDFQQVLKDYPVLLVGVHCPKEELERREENRGDRTLGQAVSQLEYVHKHEIYDIEVDTFNEDVNKCCRKITDALYENTKESAYF